MQSFILTEVSGCGLLIIVASSLFFCFFVFFVLCVRVRVYLRMYVRAYLEIPCVSANDNVKHLKSNVRYLRDKKMN